jgi:hypothetical protein
MTALKARKCFVPRSPSHWVAKVFLTCDNMLAVQFNRGQKVKKILAHGPGAYLGRGGVPHVCCLYPGTQGELAEQLYELAQVWAYGGEWVHAFLYKKFGYRIVQPPAMCGGCNTSCAITSNNASPAVGDVVTFTATITNTDGSTTYGDAPQGTVTFNVDGSSIGTVTLPDNDPDTQNYESASINWTATSGTHTVEAAYTPSEPDYAATNCSMTVTVSGGGGGGGGGGGVTSTCCPSNPIPTTLYATLSGSATGTIPLTYSSSDGSWTGSFGICGTTVAVSIVCMFGSGWNITLTGGAFWNIFPEQTSYTCNPFGVSWSGLSGTCSNNNAPVFVNISVTT